MIKYLSIEAVSLETPFFEIQLFALNTNVTTQTGTGQNLSPEMKTFYDMELIEKAEADLIHDQFGKKKPIPKNAGKTIEFRAFTPLDKALTPLTEGVTPNGQKLDTSYQTATLNQYGGYVTQSDVLEMTAIDNTIIEAMRLISSQAGRTLDTVTREVLNAGTNVIYAPAGSTAVNARSAVAATSLMTLDVIRNASLSLRRHNAPRIDGSYVAIIHPDVAMDVRALAGWIDVVRYGDPSRVYKGEIGMIEGIRFIENTEAKIFSAAGANSGNVYSTLFLGQDAFGVTNLTGGGLEIIVKQKGSAGTEDPLNQRSTIGWKALKAVKILVPEYLVRVESSSTHATTAIIT